MDRMQTNSTLPTTSTEMDNYLKLRIRKSTSLTGLDGESASDVTLPTNALFINISMVLWAMNIEQATDEKGEWMWMGASKMV